MAKKKRATPKRAPVDTQAIVATLIVRLLHHVAPTLDTEAAYELALVMVEDGLSEDAVEFYGPMLRGCVVTAVGSQGVH